MQTNGGGNTGVRRAVDEINLTCRFIQPNLEVRVASPGVVGRSPLNIEDTVRRHAADRREDAAAGSVRSQVIPKRHYRIGERSNRQRTDVGKRCVAAGELQVTVRTYVGASECRSIVAERERQSDVCRKIIGVVADIDRSWNDRLSRHGGEGVAASLSRDTYRNHLTAAHGQGKGYGCTARKSTGDADQKRSGIRTGAARGNGPEILGCV